MTHTSNFKLIDLIFANFFGAISTKFNQIIWAFFAYSFTSGSIGNIPIDAGIIYVVVWLIVYLLVLSVVVIFIFLFIILWTLFTSNLKKGVLGKYEYKFFDDYFLEKNDYTEEHIKYSFIENVFTRIGSIYIKLPNKRYCILPNRDFETSKDRDAMLEFLQKKLGMINESDNFL